MPEPWQPFEEVARDYEAWYDTRRGQRADQAERALFEWLVGQGPGAGTVLDVGCGTGHFAAWLERRRHRVVGLERSPAMLAELHRWQPRLPVVLGDGHMLPFRDGAVDVTLFVTTLEFLERPAVALPEAVRVSRRGLVIVTLNRWTRSLPALETGATWPHPGPRARQDDPVSARPRQTRRRAPLD